MSNRRPQHLGHVLCPSLAGEHFFAVIGAQGYAHGILARTLKGFLHTATRLALSEGFDKVGVMAPARIAIVSPDSETLERLKHDYGNAELDRVRDRVAWALRDLLRANDPLPEGFEAIRKPREDSNWRATRAGHVIVAVPSGGARDRYFAWTGKTPFMERFGPFFEERHPAAVEGEPSKAPPHRSGRLWYAMRGYDGGVGSKPSVGDLEPRGPGFYTPDAILRATPAFFFTVTEELPGVLDPVWQSLSEHRAQREAAREAELVAHQAQMAAEERAELEATRAIFRPRADPGLHRKTP